MNDFRVSTQLIGSTWDHKTFPTREEAEQAAKDIAKGGFFAVVARMDEVGAAHYCCEFAPRARSVGGAI